MSHAAFHDVIYLLCNALSVYGTYKSMDVFFDKSRVSKKTIIMLFVAYLLINSGLYLIMGNPVVNLLTNIILFFLLTFNYVSSVFKKLIATVAVYLISMATESIVYFALVSFIPEQGNADIIDITVYIASSILFCFIVALLGNLKNIKKTDNKISLPYLLALAAIFICSIYASIALADERIKYNNIYTAFGIAAVLAINILAVYIYDILNKNYQKELEHKLLEKQNNFYVRQLEIMQQSQNDIRMMNHDLNNHMISIKSMAADNDHIREYANNFIKSSEGFGEYSKSGNVVIDSIVNYKLREAVAKGIEIEKKIKVPPSLGISPFDMSIILGNLLDNAIEAASKSKNAKKIQINIYFEKSSLYIHIENTFDGNVIVEGEKYKTTHPDKTNHGLGLLSVSGALAKYDGAMNISYTESLFSVKIFIDNAI
ncbi:MAG: GHKL domain-containing protein [Oscillospiraceae bacterium]|nr:GHKL domain-containing protein [Oscillospiraceae bacterium]